MKNDNDLLNNMGKIHVTELETVRIRKNLELGTQNVVKWCKQKIKQANNIHKKGKNWYISFLKLKEIDFKLLYKWYNTDFVNKWYGKEKQKWTYNEIKNKYMPYIQEQKPTDSYLILCNDMKIGYIQTYLLKNYPEYNELVQAGDNSAGIDLLIGEKEYIHKGLGPIIIKKFLKDIVFQNINIKNCVIGPEPENIIAIKAYKKVGFKYIKTIKIPDENEPEYIMEISKDEIE